MAKRDINTEEELIKLLISGDIEGLEKFRAKNLDESERYVNILSNQENNVINERVNTSQKSETIDYSPKGDPNKGGRQTRSGDRDGDGCDPAPYPINSYNKANPLNLGPGEEHTVQVVQAGQYISLNVIRGNVYHISTCGGSTEQGGDYIVFDTQLTAHDTRGNEIAYNDDWATGDEFNVAQYHCEPPGGDPLAQSIYQSYIYFNSGFTGVVRISLHHWNCNPDSTRINSVWVKNGGSHITDVYSLGFYGGNLPDSYFDGGGYNTEEECYAAGHGLCINNNTSTCGAPQNNGYKYNFDAADGLCGYFCGGNQEYDPINWFYAPGHQQSNFCQVNTGCSNCSNSGTNDQMISVQCNTLGPACGVAGCTDSTAVNYNPSATANDGTCLYNTDCGTTPTGEPAMCVGGCCSNYWGGNNCDGWYAQYGFDANYLENYVYPDFCCGCYEAGPGSDTPPPTCEDSGMECTPGDNSTCSFCGDTGGDCNSSTEECWFCHSSGTCEKMSADFCTNEDGGRLECFAGDADCDNDYECHGGSVCHQLNGAGFYCNSWPNCTPCDIDWYYYNDDFDCCNPPTVSGNDIICGGGDYPEETYWAIFNSSNVLMLSEENGCQDTIYNRDIDVDNMALIMCDSYGDGWNDNQLWIKGNFYSPPTPTDQQLFNFGYTLSTGGGGPVDDNFAYSGVARGGTCTCIATGNACCQTAIVDTWRRSSNWKENSSLVNSNENVLDYDLIWTNYGLPHDLTFGNGDLCASGTPGVDTCADKFSIGSNCTDGSTCYDYCSEDDPNYPNCGDEFSCFSFDFEDGAYAGFDECTIISVSFDYDGELINANAGAAAFDFAGLIYSDSYPSDNIFDLAPYNWGAYGFQSGFSTQVFTDPNFFLGTQLPSHYPSQFQATWNFVFNDGSSGTFTGTTGDCNLAPPTIGDCCETDCGKYLSGNDVYGLTQCYRNLDGSYGDGWLISNYAASVIRGFPVLDTCYDNYWQSHDSMTNLGFDCSVCRDAGACPDEFGTEFPETYFEWTIEIKPNSDGTLPSPGDVYQFVDNYLPNDPYSISENRDSSEVMDDCYCDATYGSTGSQYYLQSSLVHSGASPHYYNCTGTDGSSTSDLRYGHCGNFVGRSVGSYSNYLSNYNYYWARECCCKQNIDDCDCNGNVLDNCGFCGGDCSGDGSCEAEDCSGTCFGSLEDLGCGCGEPGPSGCDNQCGSTAEVRIHYYDADGDGLGSGSGYSYCETTVSCPGNGTPGWCLNNDDLDDDCFTNDRTCDGVCGGTAFLDDCGVCSGGESGHEANSDKDCNGDCFGLREIDGCGNCTLPYGAACYVAQPWQCAGYSATNPQDVCVNLSGGTTGTCVGNAEFDFCGVCNGDNTSCCGNGEATSESQCSCYTNQLNGTFAGGNPGDYCSSDCDGPMDGTGCCDLQIDCCGVCGGDESSCNDCCSDLIQFGTECYNSGNGGTCYSYCNPNDPNYPDCGDEFGCVSITFGEGGSDCTVVNWDTANLASNLASENGQYPYFPNIWDGDGWHSGFSTELFTNADIFGNVYFMNHPHTFDFTNLIFNDTSKGNFSATTSSDCTLAPYNMNDCCDSGCGYVSDGGNIYGLTQCHRDSGEAIYSPISNLYTSYARGWPVLDTCNVMENVYSYDCTICRIAGGCPDEPGTPYPDPAPFKFAFTLPISSNESDTYYVPDSMNENPIIIGDRDSAEVMNGCYCDAFYQYQSGFMVQYGTPQAEYYNCKDTTDYIYNERQDSVTNPGTFALFRQFQGAELRYDNIVEIWLHKYDGAGNLIDYSGLNSGDTIRLENLVGANSTVGDYGLYDINSTPNLLGSIWKFSVSLISYQGTSGDFTNTHKVTVGVTTTDLSFGHCGDYVGIGIDGSYTQSEPYGNFYWARECCCKQNVGDCDCNYNLFDGCDVCGGDGCGCDGPGDNCYCEEHLVCYDSDPNDVYIREADNPNPACIGCNPSSDLGGDEEGCFGDCNMPDSCGYMKMQPENCGDYGCCCENGNGNVGDIQLLDCAGICDGEHTIDECGRCTLPNGATCSEGSECGSGVCGGGNCTGDATVDECGNCNGDAYVTLCATYYDPDSDIVQQDPDADIVQQPDGYNYGRCNDMDCAGNCKRVDDEGVPPTCPEFATYYSEEDCTWDNMDTVYNPFSFIITPVCMNPDQFFISNNEGCCRSGITDICCLDSQGNGLCDNSDRLKFCRLETQCQSDENGIGSGCPPDYMVVEEGTLTEDFGCFTSGDGNFDPLANVDYCRNPDGTVIEDKQYACQSDQDCEDLGLGEDSTCDGSCIGNANFDIVIDNESNFGIGDNIIIIGAEGSDSRFGYFEVGDDTLTAPRYNFNYGGWINMYYFNLDYPDSFMWKPKSYELELFDCSDASNICEDGILDSQMLIVTFNDGLVDEYADIRNFIEDGYLYTFSNVGDYAVRITMVDIDDNEYKNQKYFSVNSIVNIEQTLNNNFLPWQGIYLPNDVLSSFKNEREIWENIDVNIDGRPSLGSFYYNSDNLSDYNFVYGENIIYDGINNFKQLDLPNLIPNPSGDYISAAGIDADGDGQIDFYTEYEETEELSSSYNLLSKNGICFKWRHSDNPLESKEQIRWNQNLHSGAYLPRGGWTSGLNCGFARCDYVNGIVLGGTGPYSGGNANTIHECLCGSGGQFNFTNQTCNSGTGNPSTTWNNAVWVEDDDFSDQIQIGGTLHNFPHTMPNGSELTNAGLNFIRQHAYWVKSSECMSAGGCIKMRQTDRDSENNAVNSYGWMGTAIELGKSVGELGWSQSADNEYISNTPSVYISWWQKTVGTADSLNRSSYVGLYGKSNDGITPNIEFNYAENNSSDTFFNDSRTKSYKNTELDKWEKFSFTFDLTEEWVDTVIPALYLYNHSNCENGQTIGCGESTIYYDNIEVRDGYNFIPDVDVRKVKYGEPVSQTPLHKYWDKYTNYSEGSFEDTTAPLEIQVYLYPRWEKDDIFADKNIMFDEYQKGNFYVVSLDWGDGTLEYINEPKLLGNNISLNHNYNESGIYEISGYMIRTKKDSDGNVLGVLHNKRFVIRININEDLNNEFEYIGGEGFTFTPYKETTPIVGGISKNSIYYKSIKRQLGILEDDTLVNVEFKNVGDKLKTELALSQMDENQLDNLDLLNYFLIERTDEVDGGNLIYSGITDTFEELGKSIGDTDIGQIRYFNEPIQMWELLGFNDSDAGIPDNDRHWKNIIPPLTEDYTIFDRSGVTMSGDDITIDEGDSQTWNGGYYYPVLPKLNEFGKFDEDLGLQGDNVPFGSLNEDGTPRNWNEDDIYAYVTNSDIGDDSLLIDIENEEVERNIFNDTSGGDIVGIGISDYKLRFDSETLKPNKNKFISKIGLGRTRDGAF